MKDTKSLPTLNDIKEFAEFVYQTPEEQEACIEGGKYILVEAGRRKKYQRGLLTQLKDMNVGDTLEFDVSRWNTIRSATSNLKKMYGVLYGVSRVVTHDEAKIFVVRKK